MYNVIEKFLENPCEKTFSSIRNNNYLLLKLFREDEDLAKEFFGQDEWSLIETADLDKREQEIVKKALNKQEEL